MTTKVKMKIDNDDNHMFEPLSSSSEPESEPKKGHWPRGAKKPKITKSHVNMVNSAIEIIQKLVYTMENAEDAEDDDSSVDTLAVLSKNAGSGTVNGKNGRCTILGRRAGKAYVCKDQSCKG